MIGPRRRFRMWKWRSQEVNRSDTKKNFEPRTNAHNHGIAIPRAWHDSVKSVGCAVIRLKVMHLQVVHMRLVGWTPSKKHEKWYVRMLGAWLLQAVRGLQFHLSQINSTLLNQLSWWRPSRWLCCWRECCCHNIGLLVIENQVVSSTRATDQARSAILLWLTEGCWCWSVERSWHDFWNYVSHSRPVVEAHQRTRRVVGINSDCEGGSWCLQCTRKFRHGHKRAKCNFVTRSPNRNQLRYPVDVPRIGSKSF